MIRKLKQFYVSLTNFLVSFMPPDDFNDVLIIRLDQLGDFVLWIDSAKEYRKLWHGKRLTLLVNANWYDLAKSLPYWDDVIPLDTMRFRLNIFYRINFLAYIRRRGFDIVISPRHSVKFTLEPPIVAISGATQKIVCEGSFPIEKRNYFTRSIPMRADVHELIRNADFLRGLGRPDFKCTAPKLFTTKTKKFKYVLVCPISFRKRKDWPLDRYAGIIGRIHNLCQISIIVAGSTKIEYPFPDYVQDLSGHTEIMRFVNLVANASLVIANDSAPIHLAVALDVPSICIGAENLGRFVPYMVEKEREGMVLPKLIYKPNVKDITIEEVYTIMKGLL